MMSPYRSMEMVSVRPQPRPWWKTLLFRFLIWKHGTFRERFKDRPIGSCPYCPDFKLKRDSLYNQMMRLQLHYKSYATNHPISILEWHKIENHKQRAIACHWCGVLRATWMGIPTGPIHLKGKAGALTCDACKIMITKRFHKEKRLADAEDYVGPLR